MSFTSKLCLPAACLVACLFFLGLASCTTTPSRPPETPATSVGFSPDGRLLASATSHAIRVYDFESRKLLKTLSALPADPTHSEPGLFRHGVGDTLVFLDDNLLASTGMGGLVSVWDARSGQRLAAIPLPEEEFASSLDFAAATGQLAIGTSEGRILLADFNGRQLGPPTPVTADIGYVWDLQLNRDGRYLASASLLHEKAPKEESSVNAYQVDTPVGFGESAFDQSYERPDLPNVRIWDLAHRERVGVLEGARDVLRMELVPEEQALVTAGDEVEVWEFLTRQQVEEVKDPSMALQSIGVGSLWVVSIAGMSLGGLPGASFGEMFLTSAQFIPTPASLRTGCAREVAVSPNARWIVSTTRGPSHNVMAVIDRADNRVVEKWSADGSVCDLEFSPDGRFLLSASSRGLLIFDTGTWKKKKFE